MGLIVVPSEIESWASYVKSDLEAWTQLQEDFFAIMQKYADSPVLAGDTYDKINEQFATYHQPIKYGIETARSMMEGDLNTLCANAGSEKLEEDVLEEAIRVTKIKIQEVDDSIARCQSWGMKFLFNDSFRQAMISEYIKLKATFEQIKEFYEEKLELLYEIERNTSHLFQQLEGYYYEIQKAVQDLAFDITQKGIRSDGSWKITLTVPTVEIDVLETYVTEATFEQINESWDLDKAAEVCGYDNKGQFLEALRLQMKEAGIVDKVSVYMFLAYLGIECEYGNRVLERRTDFSDVNYTENTKGAGLSQVTGSTGKEYIKYLTETLPEGDLKEEAKRLLEGYSEDGNQNSAGNAAGFIAENFPVESATWFWGTHLKCVYYPDNVYQRGNGKSVTFNEYITLLKGKNLDNVYYAMQCRINGINWSDTRIQKICNEPETYEPVNGIITIIDEEENIEVAMPVPNGWTEREQDWENIQKIM